MTRSRYRTLLAVAIALASVRFVIVPWLEHQSQRRDALQILTQRFDRSEGLIAARETIVIQAKTVETASLKARTRYPVAVNAAEFRLQIQQKLASLAQECGVLIPVFDFLSEGEESKAGLNFVRVRLQFQGPIGSVARLHGLMEGNLRHVFIRRLQFDSQTPIAGGVDAGVQGYFLLDAYFIVGIPGKSP